VVGTSRAFWVMSLEAGGKGRPSFGFRVATGSGFWILDFGFFGLIFFSFLFFPPLKRARRRHLHQRMAWTHRFRALAWAVRLLVDEVMILRHRS
jgi:hypothetical protein